MNFLEFHRDVVNALREPLEDSKVSIARARGTATFPANFMLIAALNPCPCGKYGTPNCRCSPLSIERYRRKISGPVADRIDMWVHVGRHAARKSLAAARKRIPRKPKRSANELPARGSGNANDSKQRKVFRPTRTWVRKEIENARRSLAESGGNAHRRGATDEIIGARLPSHDKIGPHYSGSL